ncbi:MAG TPA: SAM-dependent methyltransferase [Thermomicrobiales bacterium]|nr:SAM-dependent methyltransferase [Thermomicrobiales bacterium]
MSNPSWAPEGVPLDRPSVARMYDFFLGGYHNFAIDRAVAEQVVAAYPDFPLIMRANRAFLRRAVTFLASQGIDQFLDLGSGIPTVGNVHEVAQAINPDARVVYVDIDPVAVAHSRAILAGNPNATVIQADARRPEQIVGDPEVGRLLDLDRPVAVLLLAFLHFFQDDAEAEALVRGLRDVLAPGSYLVISHASYDDMPTDVRERLEGLYTRTPTPVRSRTREQIADFFAGFDLVEPGLVYVPAWRPEGPGDLWHDEPDRVHGFAGVGRKPERRRE